MKAQPDDRLIFSDANGHPDRTFMSLERKGKKVLWRKDGQEFEEISDEVLGVVALTAVAQALAKAWNLTVEHESGDPGVLVFRLCK